MDARSFIAPCAVRANKSVEKSVVECSVDCNRPALEFRNPRAQMQQAEKTNHRSTDYYQDKLRLAHRTLSLISTSPSRQQMKETASCAKGQRTTQICESALRRKDKGRMSASVYRRLQALERNTLLRGRPHKCGLRGTETMTSDRSGAANPSQNRHAQEQRVFMELRRLGLCESANSGGLSGPLFTERARDPGDVPARGRLEG